MRVAFIAAANANPERSYDQPDLWVADIAGGAPRNLTAGYDFDIGGGVGGVQGAPRASYEVTCLNRGRRAPDVADTQRGPAGVVSTGAVRGCACLSQPYQSHSAPSERV